MTVLKGVAKACADVHVELRAEIGDRGDVSEIIVLQFQAEVLFECGLELHAAQRVEVKVLGEA